MMTDADNGGRGQSFVGPPRCLLDQQLPVANKKVIQNTGVV